MNHDIVTGFIFGITAIFSLFGIKYFLNTIEKKDYENQRLDAIQKELHEIKNQLKMR